MPRSRSATEPGRLASIHLGLILSLGALALLAVTLARVDFLVPEDHVFNPLLFTQLLSFHEIVLRYFVLLPVVPLVFGLILAPAMAGVDELAFPRLAGWASACFGLASGLILLALLLGRVEPGWTYAMGSEATRELVSPVFLGALLFLFVSLQLTGLNLIVTLHRARVERLPMFATSLYWTGWMMQVILPLGASALALGLAESTFHTGVFDGSRGGLPTLLPWLWGITSTPLQVMVLLPALGLIGWILQVDDLYDDRRLRRMRWAMAGLTLLSLPALDLRVLPDDMSWLTVQAAGFYKCLMWMPLLGLVIALLVAVRAGSAGWTVSRLYAVAALLLLVAATPIDLFFTLGGATGVFGHSYLAEAHRLLMVAGTGLLVLLGGLHHRWREHEAAGGNGSTFFGVVVVVGLLATHVPMILLGHHALPTGFAVYPKQFLPLHALIAAGGTLFALGMAGSILHALRRPSTPPLRVHA